MYHLDRKGKCGEGAYGVVYEAKLTVKKDNGTKVEKVATRWRNFDGGNILSGKSFSNKVLEKLKFLNRNF